MATLKVRIPKAAASIEVNVDQFSAETFEMIVAEGLKVLLNAKMTKIKTKDLEGAAADSAKTTALEAANKNLADLYAGKTRKRIASDTKVDTKVKAEAMRLARADIKDKIRANGMIVSHVEPKLITEAAKKLLESEAGAILIAQATENLAAVKPAPAIDLSSLGIAESPRLKAKAEEAKAERKTQLSAKQAGKSAPVPPRRQPAPAQHVH